MFKRGQEDMRERAAMSDIVEQLVDMIRRDAQTLLSGLADRPKPGAKAKARAAVRGILTQNLCVWRMIEGRKPLILQPSGNQTTLPAAPPPPDRGCWRRTGTPTCGCSISRGP